MICGWCEALRLAFVVGVLGTWFSCCLVVVGLVGLGVFMLLLDLTFFVCW